jgi:PIN domain nuclease of toxin-antitoxin system
LSGLLLDTNAFLLLVAQPEKVAAADRSMFSKHRARYVSQVCAIEIAIKFSLGKLPMAPNFRTDFAKAFADLADDLAAEILPIDLKHIDRLSRLPLIHRDPFDRLIIAQSLQEGLTIVTRDRAFAAYPGLSLLQI